MTAQPYISAPLWRRFAALAYDSLILCAVALLYSALVTAVFALVLDRQSSAFQPMFSGAWSSLGLIFTLVLFYSWFWHKSGQTIGMKTWRIAVVDAKALDRPPSWKQCWLRCLSGVPSFWVFALGYLYRWLDPERACLHDRLSATRVVLLDKSSRQR